LWINLTRDNPTNPTNRSAGIKYLHLRQTLPVELSIGNFLGASHCVADIYGLQHVVREYLSRVGFLLFQPRNVNLLAKVAIGRSCIGPWMGGDGTGIICHAGQFKVRTFVENDLPGSRENVVVAVGSSDQLAGFISTRLLNWAPIEERWRPQVSTDCTIHFPFHLSCIFVSTFSHLQS